MKQLPSAPAIGQEDRSFAQNQARETLSELQRRDGVTGALGVNSSWLQSSTDTKIQILDLTFL
jgi:hypothetical protein